METNLVNFFDISWIFIFSTHFSKNINEGIYFSSCTLPTPAPARRHGPGVRLGVKRAGGGSGAGAGGASSFQDDFQVISQNHLLASINMRHAHYPAPRHQVTYS